MPALPRLSSLNWQRAFSPVAVKRGLECAANDQVRDLRRLDGGGLHWSAQVEGSGDASYATEVQVMATTAGGVLRVISTCTCPMESLCKHAAAVIHAAQLQEQAPPGVGARPLPRPRSVADAPADAPPEQAWQRWIERIAPTPATSAALLAVNGDEAATIGLLVRAATHGDPPQLLAAVVAFGRGKKGQPVDPHPIPIRDGTPTLAPAGGWPDDDLLALMLLLERQTERVGTIAYASLAGRARERAFEHLLLRYPVYLERAAQPLAPGPRRRLELRWEDLPDGRQRLGWRAADATSLKLLQSEHLWYIDPDAAQIGRIDADPRLLELARSAPLLEPEQVGALRRQLRAADLPLPIPAPRERAPPRLLQVTPRPTLKVRSFTPAPNVYGGRTQTDPVGVAQLGFDYGGEALGYAGPLPGERERRMRGGELVEIVRDAAAERAAIERARDLDLVPPSTLPWPLGYSYSRLGIDHLLYAPGANRQPQPPDAWTDVLRRLHDEGWRLDYEGNFPRPLREIEAGDWDADLSESGSAWFDLSLGIDLDGRRVDLLPILRDVLADPRFPLRAAPGEAPDARWRVVLDHERALLLPLARVRTLLAPLLDWLQLDGGVRLHRTQGETLRALDATVRWRNDTGLRDRLLDMDARELALPAPPGFRAKLRPYQREGLAWLEFLARANLGGVLADDMGLGKTVQVLAHVLMQKQNASGPFRVLVVAPTSLMGNWREEAARFAPDLATLVLHGPDRADRYDEIATHDLILTTYPLLPRDRDRLLQHEFNLLVLDEAQAVKNARSQAAQVVRELRATRRLAMTGTPLENHLGELWAQFDAVEPGLLGSERDFTRLYRTPIEKHGDRDRQQRLHRRIGSLLLRRRKDEVLKDLPPKTEIVRTLDLEGAQRELYETLRLAQHERVREAIAERGLAQSGIVVLDALLKLRQACCDPRLVKLPAARRVTESAKLDALAELLVTLMAEGRRVLLFSQFTSMLDLIEPVLEREGIEFLRLTGDTPGAARAGLVRKFQQGDVPLFLVSLKAGGVGLNLTAADTVIHYDPWWNPAVERQATDRAHRIGQNKPVFVYKLICAGTVEEKILALQTRKAELAQAVLEGGRSTQLRFDEADLAELFAPMA